MDRTLRQVVLALVAVLVVAVAAATLPNPVTSGVGGSPTDGWGNDPGESDGIIGNGGDGVIPIFEGGDLAFQGWCIPELRAPWVKYGIVLVFLAVGALVYRRLGLLAAVGVVAFLAMPVLLFYPLLTACGRGSDVDPEAGIFPRYNVSALAGAGQGGGGGGGGSIPSTSPTFLVVLAGIGLVLLAVFLLATGDESEPEERDVVEADREPTLGELGAVAGRAADRIEDQRTVENEVYRAWREMTDHLDLDRPATATPGEFAKRATAAGMDDGHVADLTELFQEVRYGGKEATIDRETKALETLRAIEDAYAGDHE